MCNVIHIRDKTGDANEVYIGRGSIWGNPYRIGPDGNRAEVIEKYSNLMFKRLSWDEYKKHEWGEGVIDPDRWKARLRTLEGKTLVCFCKPKACHGDVLKELVERK